MQNNIRFVVFFALAICCPIREIDATETVPIATHTFTIPDGYELKQIAAPPLVSRPIHMCFDDIGVLYVTDSSGNTDKAPVQLNDPQHRVLRLVDNDGDGVFDESTVFADELPLPEGILVHDGSVYVGAPPHIWKLRDTDGDHVADERTEWFDGGSIEGCGNDMHGPYRGPDGFFYWCKGGFAPQHHELSNGRTLKSSAAHIYRARPDGSQLELVITGGMNNPVGLAFSETGERFLSGTFFDLSQPGRRDGILHAVYGGTYGRQNKRVLSPHPNTGDLLPILTHLGPAAPSGMMMARHPTAGLNGDLLCTEFNTRRVSRHQLARSGSSYSAKTTTFLESDNTDFHPTDVIEDADGSMLIADTGSWYMICCPTSKVAKPDILGAIYRLQKKGGIGFQPVKSRAPTGWKPIPLASDPRGLKLDWNQPQVSWLSDQRPAVVKRAIDALANKHSIAGLRRARAKIPAVWTLNRIQAESAREAVREFLSDKDADVRAAAIHSIALWRDKDAAQPLIELLSDDDPQLRRLAAMALGRIGESIAVKPLLNTYSTEADPFLKHAIIHAIYEIDNGDLPANHPVTKQVRLMQEIDQRNITPDKFPEIKLAKVTEAEPEKIARQKRRLDELAAYLPKADQQRGEKLFSNRDKSKCIICHLKGKQGVRLGPDLTRIGAIRSERDLLEAIVYPSATIARYHETVNVLTKDGRAVSGLLVKETMDKIFLATEAGVLQPVRMKEIEEARYSSVSLMPDGLDGVLKPQEIADIVAFLKASTSPNESVPRTSEIAQQPIPPHRAIALPGLHAYAQKSIAAGQEIKFRVSSRVPYKLSVVQLGPDPENRDSDPLLATFADEKPRQQPIHPGSYVHIDNGLPSDRPLTGLTLECWIRPFSLGGWQGLISQHDYPDRCGIGLFINDGRIAFMTGSGGKHNPSSLHQTAPGLIKTQRWYHVAATWNGKVKRVFIDGKPVGEWPYAGPVRPGKTALRIAAYGSKGAAENFYNGDIAMLSLYDQAIGLEQIQKRVADQGLTIPKGNAVLACWPFTEERGTRVADAGVDGRHGRIINRGTWMIGGPSFDAAAIDRHDTTYDPTIDPDRGHGLRLASDELYNARWKVNHRFRIPDDAKSGVYAGRFDFEIDGKPMRYFTTFIVRRGEPGNPKRERGTDKNNHSLDQKAPLLVLMSTNTWLAYNSAPFPVNHDGELTKMGTGGLPTTHPDAATYSGYRDHRHGQPTYKIGTKLPWPAAGPNKTYVIPGYSHLMRGERFLLLWLDQHGYDYDVITDRDLDRNPKVLDGYQAVVINGHSEYWSARAYDGVDNYLKAGGDALVLSGNTMFWRVSFDDTDEVMEVRKYGTGIGGRKLAQVGELYHSHDFRRGSLMRFCGYPAWKVVGLTCIGWGGAFKPYQVDQPDHFLFNTPHQVGLKKGDVFGMVRPDVGAVGHEFDVRLSTLQRATADSAIKGLFEPEGIVTVASSNDDRRIIDYNAEGHKPRIGDDQTIAEIIYWERPTGGRVFHTGSIATAWGAYHDDPMSKLLKNVLHHFGVESKQRP